MTRPARRPWWRLGWGGCGCEHPRRHEQGCGWSLDPDSRVKLAMATVVDGFPAPRLSLEREFEVIVEVHQDKDYARRVADWISSGRAA